MRVHRSGPRATGAHPQGHTTMRRMQALYEPRLPGRALAALGALVLGLALAPAARADRPLVSETADVIDAGECQVELGVVHARQSGTSGATGQDVFASCGTPWRTQVGLLAARARTDDQRIQGLGLLAKTTLVAPEDDRIGLGIAYGVLGERLRGEHWKHGATRITGVATRKLARQLLGHLNLGWLRTESDRLNNTVWSLGVESEGGPWGWAADIYGDDRSRPWLSGGLLVELTDGLSLNLSYAQQFDSPRVRQWTLGAKIGF